MSIAILADTTQIARLVVPKALLLQSAQVVQSRIGGLVGREIRHIPFSRRTPSTDEVLCLYRDLHKEIREESGVLLTTSDHMMSFNLSGLQRLVDSKKAEADAMIRFQESLTRFSRDVIDESDFTLGVKTQLIYPVSVHFHSLHPRQDPTTLIRLCYLLCKSVLFFHVPRHLSLFPCHFRSVTRPVSAFIILSLVSGAKNQFLISQFPC